MNAAERTLLCLISSEVIGLNEDGSVWVSGGRQWKVNRVAWMKGERYAHPGSPMAQLIQRLMERSRA